jgi:allantoinase
LSNINKIYSSRCWVNGKLQPATVCFENGVITDILFNKEPGALDADNQILMPGIIDAHAHINEPGRTEWEGFNTATRAAAAGGITTVVDMPLNASPVTTTLKAFNIKLDAAKNKLQVNVGFYGGLIPGNADHLEDLINAGVLGIKCFLTHSGIDEFPNVTEKDLDEAMPIIAKHKIPLLVHCELEADCVHSLKEFPTSYREYLAGRPKDWENNAIAMMIRLCREYNCPVHIVHVASADALSLIEAAKKEGLLLTAETCPHYIYFAAENIPDGSCVYKCAPPIREKENNELLKDALVKGVLDFIATDHSPATPDIKELESGNLLKAWGGIAGIQFLLPASWTALKDRISLEQFIPLLTEHPAKFIGASTKGKIEKGFDADLMIWNPDAKKNNQCRRDPVQT